MNWQDIFEVTSGMGSFMFNGMYIIRYKGTNILAGQPMGYNDVFDAFKAAEELFNRLENELEEIILG